MVPPPGREIPAAATLTIEHDAYSGRVRGAGFAVVSRMGAITVVDDQLRIVRRLDLGGPLGDLSIADDRWAWIADARLWLGEIGRAHV